APTELLSTAVRAQYGDVEPEKPAEGPDIVANLLTSPARAWDQYAAAIRKAAASRPGEKTATETLAEIAGTLHEVAGAGMTALEVPFTIGAVAAPLGTAAVLFAAAASQHAAERAGEAL